MASNLTNEKEKIFNYPGKNARLKVWEHFGFVKVKNGPPTKENLDMSKALCKICRKMYSYNGNTTSMIFHLKHEHKEMTTPGVLTKRPTPAKQLKISDWNKTSSSVRPLASDKKQRIDESLVNLIVDRLVLFSMIEHPSFIKFAKELDERSTLENELANVTNIVLTHDAWSSINTQSFDTVTVHYISAEWEIKSAVLRTQLFVGSHTGQNIADNLEATAKEWKLPPNPIAVTDNAANERKAFELLGWTRSGCYGHRINLVVKSGLKINEISRIIARGRSVVQFFHQSPLAMGVLLNKQKLLLEEAAQGHKLIQDMATRWNNTLDMLVRLGEQLPALQATVLDTSLTKKGQEIRGQLHSYDEQAIVDSLIEVLAPFKIATELLSGEKYPTQYLIIPTIIKLQKALEIQTDDKQVIVKVKTEMQRQLEDITEDRDIPMLASLLNPATKELRFLAEDDREKAKSLLYDEMCKDCVESSDLSSLHDLHLSSVESDSTVSSHTTVPSHAVVCDDTVESNSEYNNDNYDIPLPPTTKKAKDEMSETSWLLDIINDEREEHEHIPIPNDVLVSQELDRYMAEPPANINSLDWWKTKSLVYPRVSKIAKKYLAVPASSISAERVFSLAGNIMNKKRSQLKPENLDKLIFLNKNKNNYLITDHGSQLMSTQSSSH